MQDNPSPNSQPSLTPKELFSKALLEIKKNVTRDDRTICAEKLKLSKITVDRYVNGQVHDNDTALKILNFMKKRIDKRMSSLE